jgi:hypothetical protein
MHESRGKTAAAYAAAISPLEWPVTAEGQTPQARKRSVNASWIAVQATHVSIAVCYIIKMSICASSCVAVRAIGGAIGSSSYSPISTFICRGPARC